MLTMSVCSYAYVGADFEVQDLGVIRSVVSDLPAMEDMNVIKNLINDLNITFTEYDSYDWGWANIFKPVLAPLAMILSLAKTIINLIIDVVKVLATVVKVLIYLLITFFGFTPVGF